MKNTIGDGRRHLACSRLPFPTTTRIVSVQMLCHGAHMLCNDARTKLWVSAAAHMSDPHMEKREEETTRYE